jgi:selenocysteine lyase/cysteine desulfurase
VAYAPGDPETVDADSYRAVLDDRVALVSVPLVSYRSGVRLPVADVAAAAHAAGARVFVDAYQAAGVLPVDVTELDCDYLVAGSMKYLLGLPGVAFLYARSAPAGDHDPVLTGWFGRVDPFAFDPTLLDFPAAARRFETGTTAVPAIYAANAGLRLINGLDGAAVARHVTGLVALAADRLAAAGERLRLAPDPADQGAHVGLLDRDPPALADWLAGRGIVVSPRGPLVRIAFHYYNNASDVAAVCAAIEEFRSVRNQRGEP